MGGLQIAEVHDESVYEGSGRSDRTGQDRIGTGERRDGIQGTEMRTQDRTSGKAHEIWCVPSFYLYAGYGTYDTTPTIELHMYPPIPIPTIRYPPRLLRHDRTSVPHLACKSLATSPVQCRHTKIARRYAPTRTSSI